MRNGPQGPVTLPISSHVLITSIVSSWVHLILSSNLSSKIQTFVARLVLLAPRHHTSTRVLEKLHWLPIPERIKYKVACVCFSAINVSGPVYLSELLHVYTPSRTLRSSVTDMLKDPQHIHINKIHGFRAISCFGPHIWNSPPKELRHCSTLSSFKAKLKTFLLSQYLCPS